MSKRKFRIKLFLIIISVFVFIFIGLFAILSAVTFNADAQVIYGVTFSKKFAEQLQLEWKQVFLAILDDLNVKYIRIPTYWEDIEPVQDQYNFEDIDWQLEQALERDVKVILVVGRRQPRWPECHDPGWVRSLSYDDARLRIKNNIRIVVERYKNNPAVEMWQVENEPFLDFFGECPKMSKKELAEEIDIVRSLDNRPVLLTDSGELSSWYPLIKMGDYFGTTLYRVTHNKYIGYWHYFFVPSSYYRVKAFLWGNSLDNTFVAELQAEPWFPNDPLETPLSGHYKTMDKDQLIKNAEYARRINFSRAYFWGVEWWYWLKTAHGDNSVWQAAKMYFR